MKFTTPTNTSGYERNSAIVEWKHIGVIQLLGNPLDALALVHVHGKMDDKEHHPMPFRG